MYDVNGEHVFPEDVLDPQELGEYYASIGYQWWRPSHD